MTHDAGVLKVLDAVSTEAGGAGAAAFKYDNGSSQKDSVTRKMNLAIASELAGVVPSELADFLIEIKQIIRRVLESSITAGDIGPYTDSSGATRGISLSTDIDVKRDRNDPVKFYYKYWFTLRYPALRFFGEFSVDNSFFSSVAA